MHSILWTKYVAACVFFRSLHVAIPAGPHASRMPDRSRINGNTALIYVLKSDIYIYLYIYIYIYIQGGYIYIYIQGGSKKVARSFVIHAVHEQWSARRHGGRGFGGSVKFADGKTSSANVPHLNVWGFDISTAEFPQPKKTRVFGVNRPLRERCHNVEQKLWKRCCNVIQEHCSNVEQQLWNVPTWYCLNVILESCKNIATTLRESCENVGTWSCCNIFQESVKSVATTLPQNIVRKHLHNIMATFIDNVEVLWYSQCCGNLSAILENPRGRYHQAMHQKNNWRIKKWCPHHFTGWFYVPLPLNKCP